jgi:hypothetical protein
VPQPTEPPHTPSIPQKDRKIRLQNQFTGQFEHAETLTLTVPCLFIAVFDSDKLSSNPHQNLLWLDLFNKKIIYK